MKNLGHSAAISQILEAQGLSPSKAVEKHFLEKLRTCKKRNAKAATPAQKKHRKSTKRRKKMSNSALESGEKYTYTKGIGLTA